MENWEQKIKWLKEKASRLGVPNYVIANEIGVNESTISRIFNKGQEPMAGTYDKLIKYSETL